MHQRPTIFVTLLFAAVCAATAMAQPDANQPALAQPDDPDHPGHPGASANAAADLVGPVNARGAGPLDEPNGGEVQTQWIERRVDAVLAERVSNLLREPNADAAPPAVQGQLAELSVNARQWAAASPTPAQRLRAMGLDMQAIYAQVVEFPESTDVDRQLSQLRATARRVKTLDHANARAVGDFWLMTAELLDMNRMDLPADARREQAEQLMRDYLQRHPFAPPSEEVRSAWTQLQAAMPPTPPPAPEGQGQGEAASIRALSQLLERIEATIPDDWAWMRITLGPVAPKGRPEGTGIQIELATRADLDGKPQPMPLVTITIMDVAYGQDQPLPIHQGPADLPGKQIGQWHGRRVYYGAWDGAEPWARFETDLRRAIDPHP